MKNYELIGSKASESMVATEDLINKMADISKDYNPIHMSEDYAKKTIFGKRIAHGLMIESLVSNLVGTKLPGPGSIFLDLSFKFKRAVYIGDTVTAYGEIVSATEKGIIDIVVECINQDHVMVANSKAKIKYL